MNVLTDYNEINEVLQNDLVMIIAKSRTCSACQTIANVLEHNVPSINDIEQHQIYIDEMDQFRGDHLIFSVPTVLIFSNGKELLRESRYINYAKIQRLIEMYQK